MSSQALSEHCTTLMMWFVPSKIIFKNLLSLRRMVGHVLAWPLGIIYCASGGLMKILAE